jgi:F0F1-type ATP synthase assembly protein I
MVLERSALIKLLGTSLLAGIAAGLCTAIPAHALGLSVAIAGGVSGTLAAIVVAVVIVRHGPTA